MQRCDVAIIGAGPAGSAVAWMLAGRHPGLDIVLCDAAEAPCRKPCGEYLSPGGVGVLARAGLLAQVEATGPQRLDAVAMRVPDGGTRVRFAPVGPWRPQAAFGLGVRRERFDRALQDAAGGRVRLRRGARLLAAKRGDDGWTLEFSGLPPLSARILIGADGRGSAVRRLCGLDRRPDRRRFALATRVRGLDTGGTVEMHLGPVGQIGICPLGDGEANINLLIAPPSAVLLRRMPRERLLRAALAATPTLRGRATRTDIGSVLATGSLPQGCLAAAGPEVALVGDAAGFCDPFTGEGMSLALAGAELLADALAGPGLPAYADTFAALVQRRRDIGEALQGLLLRRRISESLVGLLGRFPLAARLLVADAAGYRRSA